MAKQEEWSERRQRIVRCKAHGLHYDPELASGCTLCLKESAKAPSQRAPQFTILLLCVLGMAVVLFQIFGHRVGSETAPANTFAGGRSGSSLLAPGDYQPLIQALERDLFGKIGDDLALATARASLATAARNLSAAVAEAEPSSETLRLGAEAVAGLAPPAEGDFGFDQLESLRGEWLRLRQRLFEPAPWFTTPERQGSRDARVSVAEDNVLASRLRVLFEEGAAEAQAYADSSDLPDRDTLLEEFRAEWRQRLADTWNERPPRPESAADPRVLIAIQNLEQAFKKVWAWSADSGFARGDQPAARFDGVLREIEAAQDAFSAGS